MNQPAAAVAASERPVATAINRNYLGDEEQIVRELADAARLPDAIRERVAARAAQLVDGVRTTRVKRTGLDAFLRQYDLSSQEGVILMCLAEALLRIPDDATADKLIADKISAGDWGSHFGEAESLFVNASTWGLMLTGQIVRPSDADMHDPRGVIARIAGRLGEPVLRAAFRQAMRIMGHQFVMGRTIEEALERSVSGENRAYRYSFDMLGEAALTDADAKRYLDCYHKAIGGVARSIKAGTAIEAAPSISVKLSALFARYEFTQRRRVLAELAPRLHELAVAARNGGIALTVDAEEAERLELSLELIERVVRSPQLKGWNGFGLAVQAYQKRTREVVRWLRDLAGSTQRAAERAAREGRVLGQRDQASAGARPRRLSRVHAQGQHRRVVHRVRARADRRGSEHLSAVRDSQRADRRDHHGAGGAGQAIVRVPAPAWHGRGAVCADRRRGQARPAVPRVCAGRLARRSAAVPGAPPAGERREYVVRQSHRRRADGHRRHRPRSGCRGGRAAAEGASAHSAAAHAVRLVAPEFARRESARSRSSTTRSPPSIARAARERWSGGRDRFGQAAPGPRSRSAQSRRIAAKSSAP